MRRTLPVLVATEDREFLWQWGRELQQRFGPDPPIGPHHFIAAIVAELRELKAQGRLFDELTELEAAVVRAARQHQQEVQTEAASRQQETESYNRIVDELNEKAMEQYLRYLNSPRSQIKWEMRKMSEKLEEEGEARLRVGFHDHT